MLTELGENVTDAAQADDVTRHYNNALAKIRATGLDCQISVKLTQLGLDADADRVPSRSGIHRAYRPVT